MQVVKVVTGTDKVFSQEVASRCNDTLTLGPDVYTLDHSADGYDIFQDYNMANGVVVNGRVMGTTVVVCRSDHSPCTVTDTVPMWSEWTRCVELPRVVHPHETGIQMNNGSITKKSRRIKFEEEEKEGEESEEDDEMDEIEEEDGDDKCVDICE